MAKRRTFFAVNRLSSLERKRGRQHSAESVPWRTCLFLHSEIDPRKNPKKPPCRRTLAVSVVETYSWKIVFSSFLLKIDGSELWKLWRKYVKLSEMKQCGLLPWGRDFYSKTLTEKASILMCIFIELWEAQRVFFNFCFSNLVSSLLQFWFWNRSPLLYCRLLS